jgi:nucleoside phosphorylase
MIAVFAAMESEVAACPAWMRGGDPSDIGGFPVFAGEGAYVCQTGIGHEKAQAAAAAVLSAIPPRAVLSVGLAGGLAPGLRVGEIVLCTHVDHESHRHADTEQTIYADEALFERALQVAGGVDVPTRSGTSLTVDQAAWGPIEKAAHHAWKAHDIVEMESFWIAEAAVKRGLPFLAIRSISDDSADTLPNIGATRPDGTIDINKFLEYLAEHPETGDQLSSVAQNVKASLATLALFLDPFSAELAGRRG